MEVKTKFSDRELVLNEIDEFLKTIDINPKIYKDHYLDVTTLKRKGHGSFGNVYEYNKNTVVKEIVDKIPSKTTPFSELQILMLVNSPFLIRQKGFFYDKNDKLCIKMERMEKTLWD